GLLLLAGVTYAEQRHFLVSRIDDQAVQAARWTQRGAAPFGGGGGGYGNPMLPPADSDGDEGPGRGHGGPGAGAPAGTWRVTRSSDGDDPQCVGCLPGSTATAPTLPQGLSPGQAKTVKATNSGGSYRVYGVTLTDGSVRYAAIPLEDTEATLHRLLRIEGM